MTASEHSCILIADDDEVLRRSLCRAFAHCGFAVTAAANGKQVLERLGGMDVVLLDLDMPELGGLEVLERVANDARGPIFIVITGHGSVGLAVQAMQLGAVDFLVKPFDTETVLEKVRQHLPTGEDSVVAYMRQHAGRIDSRSEVAQALGLAVETVSRCVHQANGKKFAAFLQCCKLDIAQGLLKSTSLNISQIADQAGFSTPEFFARVCKRELDMSPSQYRRHSRLQRS